MAAAPTKFSTFAVCPSRGIAGADVGRPPVLAAVTRRAGFPGGRCGRGGSICSRPRRLGHPLLGERLLPASSSFPCGFFRGNRRRRPRGNFTVKKAERKFLSSGPSLTSDRVAFERIFQEPPPPSSLESYLLPSSAEKPKSKDWRELLVFREEWSKYRQSFYDRLQARASAEADATMKQRLLSLARKIRKVDDELETYTDLLEEIQQNPKDIDAIVARRRKEFTGDFFRHITTLSEAHDSLEDRDAMARLGARCLSAVSAYDYAVRSFQEQEGAQSKFDDILNSSSLELACEKIRSLARAKELDSSLILLINQTWAAAKASKTIKNEAKEIMRQIYRATQKSLKSIAPPEIKLLKHLLNIGDPEERFSALATAFCPGDEREAKRGDDVIYTTPKELHKWIKIMVEAHQLNKEETEMRDARSMADPVVIQRLFILKETIEEEYLKRQRDPDASEEPDA